MSGSPRLHPAATPDEEGMEVAETLELFSKTVYGTRLVAFFQKLFWHPFGRLTEIHSNTQVPDAPGV